MRQNPELREKINSIITFEFSFSHTPLLGQKEIRQGKGVLEIKRFNDPISPFTPREACWLKLKSGEDDFDKGNLIFCVSRDRGEQRFGWRLDECGHRVNMSSSELSGTIKEVEQSIMSIDFLGDGEKN